MATFLQSGGDTDLVKFLTKHLNSFGSMATAFQFEGVNGDGCPKTWIWRSMS
jgi:hypothetical protein